MTLTNASNAMVEDTGTLDTLDNTSHHDYYVDYDIWEYSDDSLRATLIVFAVSVAILVVCDVILLLTCLSKEARAKSASWYLYHMTAMAVISGVIVIPTENFGQICKFSLLLSRVISCVRGINIVLVSVEIIATILAPRPSWERNRKFRFYVSFGCVWLFSIVLVSIILSVNSVSYKGHDGECFIYGKFEIIVLYIIKTWIPGILVLGLTIAAVVIYNRSRLNGTYDQVSEIPGGGAMEHRRDWFLCLLVVNLEYLLLDIVFWEVHMAMVGNSTLELVLLIVTNVVVYVMPLAMLVLHEVRLTLGRALTAMGEAVQGRLIPQRGGGGDARSRTSSSAHVMLDMGTINDQEL